MLPVPEETQAGNADQYVQVRLVVGKINLVEKIAQLASIKPEEVATLEKERRLELGQEVMKRAMEPPSGGERTPPRLPRSPRKSSRRA